MSNTCTVCAHPQRDEILKTLMRRAEQGKPSLRAIGLEFNLDKHNLSRHLHTCIPADVAAARAIGMIQRGIKTEDEAFEHYTDARKFAQALRDWLADPTDRQRFTLNPRANEVFVVYEDGADENGKPLRAKEPLQTLLDRITEQLGVQIVSTRWGMTNPRQLFLQHQRSVIQFLTFYAKLHGDFAEDKDQNQRDERDYVALVRQLARKYTLPEKQVARDIYERNEQARPILAAEWPELSSAGTHKH